MDYNNMSKKELIEQLEKDINIIEKLKKKQKKLGINFETPNNRKERGKIQWDEKIADTVRENIPVLINCDDKTVIMNKNAPTHELIKGDNFPALLTLLPEYKNKVNVIYIDPPYNTGSKDFIYNDRYIDKEDEFKHSTWLSFMARRLLLAQELLSDDGAIFVSIDDNEQHHLRMLMDKIFGEKNFIANMIQEKGNSQNNRAGIQKNHEYVLVYRKSEKVILSEKIVKVRKVFKDDRGFYLKAGLTTGVAGLNERVNSGYTLYYNPNSKEIIPFRDQDLKLAKTSNNENLIYSNNLELLQKGFIPIRPPKTKGKLGIWSWGLEKAMRDKSLIFISQGKNGYSVKYKNYVNKDNVHKTDKGYELIKEETIPPRSLLKFPTSAGTISLSNVISSGFNNPKNLEMLKTLINFHPNKNSIVLDFFAGSGTTGQAVAELNVEDGGHRKAILVTDSGKSGDYNSDMSGSNKKEISKNSQNLHIEEKKLTPQTENKNTVDIAEEITYERMKRVLTGKDWVNPKKAEALNQNLIIKKVNFISKNVKNRKTGEIVFDKNNNPLRKTDFELRMEIENIMREQGYDFKEAELYSNRLYNSWVKFADDELGDLEQWD